MARRFSTGMPFREGGTASLYTARDLALGRTVVLKVPHSAGPLQIERTFREARALAAVRHRGVCQVYEVGFDEGRPFIALEWVEGRTLREIAPELPLRENLELVAQVAEAIAAVHRAGIIHRDLKPENVVVRVTPEGERRPVVVDFGLVRLEEEPTHRPEATQAGTPMGTPGYMAPEQILGEAGKIDARTDVYGLGAILYSVLTGHAVFEGEGAAQVMFRTLQGEPKPPRAWVPDLPADLEAIVLQCLAPEPARRYPGAEEVAADLRRFLAGQAVRARSSNRLARFARRLRRHPWRASLAAGVALAAIAGGMVARSEIVRHGDREAFYQRWADDAVWRLRAESMAPRHDVSASDARIAAGLRQVTAELEELDGPARANAHFALGRVWTALRDDDRAERHLRAAWKLGQRNPEVAYTLGLVLGRRYETAMARAARIADPELRAERARRLDAELRVPARSFLARAGGARLPVPEEYPQVLIAAHDGRVEEALSTLAALRRRVPWFYEAWITEADVLVARSTTAYAGGEVGEALKLMARAHAAYAEALSGGQSDPVVHEGLCGSATDVAGLRMELGLPVGRDEVEGALAACAAALAVAPRHPTTLSVVGRAHEFAARYYLFQEGDGEKGNALLDRAATLATKASELEPGRPDILLTLLAILVTQHTFGQVPDAAWLARFERSSRGLEAQLRQEHGSLDFVLLLHAYNARQKWAMRELRPIPPDLERLIRVFLADQEKGPRSSTVPAALVYSLRTLIQMRDVYGQPTNDLDTLILQLAEQAMTSNPRFIDSRTSLAVALTYDGTRRCVRGDVGEEWRSAFERAEAGLAEFRKGKNAINLAGVRTAWVQLATAQCALANGEEATALADRAGRTTSHWATIANDKSTIEVRRAARLLLLRSRLASGRTSEAEMTRVAALPPLPEADESPLAALEGNEMLLTQADLALELGRDASAPLAQVQKRLERVEATLLEGAPRPIALDRQKALLRFLRERAEAGPLNRSRLLAAGEQVLALTLTGTRADLGWSYWRRRVARLLAQPGGGSYLG